MLVPGLLCLRGWSHTGDILYAMSSVLLGAGAFVMLRDNARGRHYGISLVVIMPCVLLGTMLVLSLFR